MPLATRTINLRALSIGIFNDLEAVVLTTLTTTERDALGTGIPPGLTIYNTTTESIEVWYDDVWKGSTTGFLKANGTIPLTDNWDVGGFKIENVHYPIADTDVATKKYVDDSTGTPTILVLDCPVTVNVGDAIYLAGDNYIEAANATSETTMPAFGFVATKPTPTTASIRYNGTLGSFTGLTAGHEYYIDTVAGKITDNVDLYTSGNVVQQVGIALNDTTLFVSINQDYATL
jgi:hypothetical protein